MKKTLVVGSLVTAFCLAGCSGDSHEEVKRLVPTSASEVTASPDYKFERTTKSGIKVYVRQLSPEMVNAIPPNSPDRAFLSKGDKPYFVVPIRDDKIVAPTKDERAEIAGLMIERMIVGDPELKKYMRDGGRAR